jgi:hypothetical protein
MGGKQLMAGGGGGIQNIFNKSKMNNPVTNWMSAGVFRTVAGRVFPEPSNDVAPNPTQTAVPLNQTSEEEKKNKILQASLLVKGWNQDITLGKKSIL